MNKKETLEMRGVLACLCMHFQIIGNRYLLLFFFCTAIPLILLRLFFYEFLDETYDIHVLYETIRASIL